MTDLRQPEVWPLSAELTEILQGLIVERWNACIINFIDPAAQADSVEVWISWRGDIGFVGISKPGREPWQEEVESGGGSEYSLVFDFDNQQYKQNGNTEDIEEGVEAFKAWQDAFCNNYKNLIYEVKFNEFFI